MAPVIRPAMFSKIESNLNAFPSADANVTQTLKRKGDEDDETFQEVSAEDLSADEEDLGNLPHLKKAGEGTVSKRTLQNRKAQREFRKRREARVRDLEERCRRYDQMGLEANSELQRVARGLKDENLALRGFIVRIGMGHIIPGLLQNGGDDSQSRQNNVNNVDLSANFQSSFASNPTFDNFGMGTSTGSGQFGEPTFYIDPSSNTNENANGRSRAMTFNSSTRSTSSDDNVNKTNNSIDATTLAPTPTGSLLMGSSYMSPEQGGQGSRSGRKDKGSPNNRSNPDTPLLSLNFAQQTQSSPRLQQPQQQERQQQHQHQQQQQQPHTSQHESHANNAQSNSADSLEALFNGGAGVGGTAMLGNNAGTNSFTPFPVSRRNQQSAALLNPNPIPFSFNLSSGADPSSIQPTWWEQMGGGADGIELDDKAQAVANAQTAGSQNAHSPFDLSTFLQGGLTPNGGFQLGHVGSSQGEQGKGTPAAAATSADMRSTDSGVGRKGANPSDTEHMRVFVQLMERKMAERDACTYASLGFQPPSQDPAQRKHDQSQPMGKDGGPTITMSGQMTPSGVYSRLAQHPAFLSTNARELEELVDALGTSSWKGKGGGGGDAIKSKKKNNNSSSNNESGKEGREMQLNRSQQGRSPDSMHVDEGAIGKMLGLLDQRGIRHPAAMNANSKGMANEDEQQSRLAMALS